MMLMMGNVMMKQVFNGEEGYIMQQGQKIPFPEEEKQKYIQEIIKADMEEAGQEDVFRKIKKDFQTASITIGDSEIRDQIDKALLRAKEDFK